MDKFNENIQYTFLDYLAEGFELNFMVAIDFTGICLHINSSIVLYTNQLVLYSVSWHILFFFWL